MSLAHQIISNNEGREQLNSEDLDDLEFHGIYFMEHMNIITKDRKKAEEFYCGSLGFKLQPDHVNSDYTFHINLGQQQFHAGTEAAVMQREAGVDFRANKLFGNIGLVVPSLEDVCKNLDLRKIAYEKSSSKLTEYPSINVSSPSGTSFYVYGLQEAKSIYAANNNIEQLTSQNQEYELKIYTKFMHILDL